MEKISEIKEGICRLLSVRQRQVPEFRVLPPEEGSCLETLEYDGKRIPVFSVRYDPVIRHIAGYGKAGGCCALNVYSFSGRDVSLRELVFRELDIAEYILNTEIISVTAFSNGGAAINMIVVMADGTRANMDLGCTMAPGTDGQCQHRLITNHGMSCDRPVGEMRTGSQLYLFGSQNTAAVTWDDDEYYLYGLTPAQIRTVLTVHALMTGGIDGSGWKEREQRLLKLTDAVLAGGASGKTVRAEEI